MMLLVAHPLLCFTLASGNWRLRSHAYTSWLRLLGRWQFCHRIPSPAQSETIISVEVAVQADLSGFFYEPVHISWCLIQHGGSTEVSVVPYIYAVLHYCRLFGVFKADVPHMLLAPGLSGSPCLPHVHLSALAWNPVYTWNLQT